MNKKPIFFRDEGEVGDVLSKAKKLREETRAFGEKIQTELESIDRYREEVENERYRQVVRGLIKGTIEHSKRWLQTTVQEWNKKKNQLDEREEVIKVEEQAILETEGRIETEINEATVEQREQTSEELQSISQLTADVQKQLEKIEATKQTIDGILTEDVETIRDKLFTSEDVQFAQLNYISLLRSRLASEDVVDPLTGKEYSRADWRLDFEDNGLVARIAKGMLSKDDYIRFNIRFIAPEEEEGFIFKRAGRETSHLITEFIQEDDHRKDSFNALVLASPTGWSDWMIEKVSEVRSVNRSVYLADLSERKMFFNEQDKKTVNFAEFLHPLPLEDETAAVRLKLEEEVEQGVLQFRVDKAAKEYQIPRRIALGAFKELAQKERYELIYPAEGAKDIILMVR